MKIQYSVESQHNTVTNKDDEIVISFQSSQVTTSFDSIALMGGLGALFVAFQQTNKVIETLTTGGKQ